MTKEWGKFFCIGFAQIAISIAGLLVAGISLEKSVAVAVGIAWIFHYATEREAHLNCLQNRVAHLKYMQEFTRNLSLLIDIVKDAHVVTEKDPQEGPSFDEPSEAAKVRGMLGDGGGIEA